MMEGAAEQSRNGSKIVWVWRLTAPSLISLFTLIPLLFLDKLKVNPLPSGSWAGIGMAIMLAPVAFVGVLLTPVVSLLSLSIFASDTATAEEKRSAGIAATIALVSTAALIGLAWR